MAVKLLVNAATALTPTATLYRKSDGFWWNATLGAWEAAPAFADRDIALTEFDATNYPGAYSGNPAASIGSPGAIRVYFHGTGITPIPVVDMVVRENEQDCSPLDELYHAETWRTWLGRMGAILYGNLTGAKTGLEKLYQPDGTTESVRMTCDNLGNRTATYMD